jgi:hypothetical protein
MPSAPPSAVHSQLGAAWHASFIRFRVFVTGDDRRLRVRSGPRPKFQKLESLRHRISDAQILSWYRISVR